MAKYPLIRSARIQKAMLGGYVAVYPCPYCKEELTSKEQEIGEPESCPHCRGIFKLDEGINDQIQGLKAQAQEQKQRKVEEKQQAKEQARQQRIEQETLRREQLVQKPQPAPRPAPQPVATEAAPAFADAPPAPDRTTCPYCKETIIAGSAKCKHCGEFLDRNLRDARAPRVKQWEPVAALLLSFLIPGAGQLYKGQPLNALLWFFITVFGYVMLIIPGIVLHTCCIIGAAMGDPYKK